MFNLQKAKNVPRNREKERESGGKEEVKKKIRERIIGKTFVATSFAK